MNAPALLPLRALRLLPLLLLPIFASGCASVLDPGPAPTRMQLLPNLPEKRTDRPEGQVVVAMPVAGRDIDTDSIALVFRDREVRYLSGVRWTNAVPALLQRMLIDSLEASGSLRGVGDETAGIAAGEKILCDVRQFSLRYSDEKSPPTAVAEASFRVVNLRNGQVRASMLFRTEAKAAGTKDADLVRAMEEAVTKLLAEFTPWAVKNTRQMGSAK